MTYESNRLAETSIEAGLKHLTYSAYLFCLADDLDNPILSLDSSSRIAFILNHLLGYQIDDAAFLTDLSENEFRACLRSAYLQLASGDIGPDVHLGEVLAEPALA